MSKTEAIQAMFKGQKITHRYFDTDEWITIENGLIVTEDGYKHQPFTFWIFREGPAWNNGYSKYKEIQQ